MPSPVDPADQAIAAAFALFQRKDYQSARRHLEGIDQPQALHLLALVEKNDGNPVRALELLNLAAEQLPNDADIANNQGNVAVQLGDAPAAESAYWRALRLRPGFAEAGTALGRMLINQSRWDDAAALYSELMRRHPQRVAVRYGLATVMLETGRAEEAEQLLDETIPAHPDKPELHFIRGRARSDQGRGDDAVRDFQAAYRASPTPYALKALAGQYWLSAQRDEFFALLTRVPSEREDLLAVAANLLRDSGSPRRAVELLATAGGRFERSVELQAVAAMASVDSGDAEAAGRHAQAALAIDATHRAARAQLIVSLLMRGEARAALQEIIAMREAEPLAQHWIAYEATARRMLPDGDDYLVDIEAHVRPYTLPVPDGYDTLADFNAALEAELDGWHSAASHPLEQSLRVGSQTPRDLRFIDSPALNAFRAAADAPIRDYLESIGHDSSHPLTARNGGGYRMLSWWSVKLRGGGYHVNHVHPEGWISSAYYVRVPECAEDSKAGWIKFGEPPFPTVPETPPQKWVRPEAGMLVLFPSFLWHGTASIQDNAVRITAPFDLEPG